MVEDGRWTRKIENRKMRAAIIALIIVVLGIGGWFVLGNRGSSEQAQKLTPTQVQGNFVKGQKVPGITFTDFEGNTYNLSQFSGKAVVLDFWAAWCPFCVEEMPELQKAQDKYRDRLVMIGVHRTDTEKPDAGLKFAKERGVSYLLVSDTTGSLYQAAGGFGMPVAVFIDSRGVIQEVKSGPKTVEEIEEKIAALLQE